MISGTIIRGDGVGRSLGYPTANIECDEKNIHLGPGVYAATAHLNGKKYIAGLVIMTDPCKVEAHLIGYTGPDVYGQELTVEPSQRVSTLERYESTEELKKKIAADILLVQQVFDEDE